MLHRSDRPGTLPGLRWTECHGAMHSLILRIRRNFTNYLYGAGPSCSRIATLLTHKMQACSCCCFCKAWHLSAQIWTKELNSFQGPSESPSMTVPASVCLSVPKVGLNLGALLGPWGRAVFQKKTLVFVLHVVDTIRGGFFWELSISIIESIWVNFCSRSANERARSPFESWKAKIFQKSKKKLRNN